MKEVYTGALIEGTIYDIKEIVAKEPKYKKLDKFLDLLFGGSLVVGLVSFGFWEILSLLGVSTILGGPISSFMVASAIGTVLGGISYKVNDSFIMGPKLRKIAEAKHELKGLEEELRKLGLNPAIKGTAIVKGRHWPVEEHKVLVDNTEYLYRYPGDDKGIDTDVETNVDHSLCTGIYGIEVVGGVAFVEIAKSYSDLQPGDLQLVKSMLSVMVNTICQGFNTDKNESDIVIDVFKALESSSNLNGSDSKDVVLFRYLFRTYCELAVDFFAVPAHWTSVEKKDFIEKYAAATVELGGIEAYSYRILEEPDFKQLPPNTQKRASSLSLALGKKKRRPCNVVYPK